MHNNDISQFLYNQASCDNTRQLQYGISSPSFRGKLPKNAEKQISDETLKIASAAIAASGIVYIGSGKQKSSLSHEQQEEIIEYFKNGLNYREISEIYGCSEKPIRNVIKAQNNGEELIATNKAARKKLSPAQEAEIIEKFKQGMTYVEIAKEFKEFGAYKELIANIILSQPNIDEIRAIHDENISFFSTEQKQEIIEKYRQGSSCEKLAGEYGCSVRRIQTVIGKQDNSEELKKQSNESRLKITPEQGLIMLQRYANGESLRAITKDICSEELFRIYVNAQPNANELNQLHEANKGFFRPEVKQQIIVRFANGESCQAIANSLKCDYGTVRDLITGLPNSEELIKQNEANNQTFSSEEQTKIIEGFRNGLSYRAVARSIRRDRGSVTRFILKQPNADELLVQNAQNRKRTIRKNFTENEIAEIVQRFLDGESYTAIAQDENVNKSPSTVRYIIFLQENAEDILLQHNKNAFNKTLKAKQADIVKSYRAGKTYREMAKEFDCPIPALGIILNEQPDIEDILAEHKRNSAFFNETQIQDILQRKTKGESNAKIARIYNCSYSAIWRIIQQELNKNKEGTTRETFSHKYEEYSIDELKTRISECISIKQVEENDELLEIMFHLDEKTKFSEDEKSACIEFIRLLDKLEQQKLSTKNVIESETIKNILDLMDRDLAKQQVFEELNKDFNIVIDDLNSCGNEAFGDICSKYIANDIDDEDNIASMKAILNIISSNNETSTRHKLVAYDNMKQNPNDIRIKEAQEIYGENNEEKIGQYLIFNKMLNGNFIYVDFENDAFRFADNLKEILYSKQAILKRLIDLEDYFNSDEAKNNSLTNFVNAFNSKDNYINKLMTDFYIDNIYKDKITTYELEPDNRFFGGLPATVIIYPEAKQCVLNYKCNWDKHVFLIDSDKSAHNFASSAYHSTGIKLFPIIEKYAKDGFNIGDNVAEIKVTGFDGCRLVAKRKNKQDRVFEIRYFKPNGFHEENKDYSQCFTLFVK